MTRRLSADRRVWSLAMASLIALFMASALPGATSATVASLPPDTDFLDQLTSHTHLPLIPFAPVTSPAQGGTALPPEERAALSERIEALEAAPGVEFGIAVQDLRTGTTFSHKAEQRFPTASVAKLTVLTMLLMRADEEDRELTSGERAQAEQMIRFSDNDVTDGLYGRMGFNEGFLRHAENLGFTRTEPNPTGVWGSTMTTPADQIRLLRALYTGEGPLSDDDRAYVRELMESVAPEQAWGVSAAAEPEDTVGLKNGWTPRDNNGGLWTVNSVGYVSGHDREYLVAVFSDHNPDYSGGVALLEELVAEVTEAIEDSGEHDDSTVSVR
ncbi:serine hydrolase [Nocardiopsis nanhaiensis]